MPLAAFCSECGTDVWVRVDGRCENGHGPSHLSDLREIADEPAAVPAAHVERAPGEADSLARSLARHERISGAIWIVLGILQVLAVVTAVAGAWNIYAATTRFRIARSIESRAPWVPASFEASTSGLLVMGIVNFALGGVVGVLFILYDWWVRGKVIENADIFDVAEPPSTEAAPTA